jgi:prophage antirepressor-like protein
MLIDLTPAERASSDLGEFGLVRHSLDSTGEPWFCCQDIAQALGYANRNMLNLFGRVPAEWREMGLIFTPEGQVSMLTVNELGLYRFLARSPKPGAATLLMKIVEDVIPMIRRIGCYMSSATIQKIALNPDFIKNLADRLQELGDQIDELERKIRAQAPKVRFYDILVESERSFDFGEAATILSGLGFNCGGRTTLLRAMVHKGLVTKDITTSFKTRTFSRATQKGIDSGYLITTTRAGWNFYGQGYVSTKAEFTLKGMEWLMTQYQRTVAKPRAALQSLSAELLTNG